MLEEADRLITRGFSEGECEIYFAQEMSECISE